MLWEQAGKCISLGDAVTLACQSHASHLSPVTLSPVTRHLSLLVGPEGGLTPEEVQLAESHGWQVVTLGPRILRAETAALAAVTVVMERCGQLGSGRDIGGNF